MDNNIQNSSMLDVAGLLRGEIRELDFDVLLDVEFDVDGINTTAPSRFKGKAVNMSGYMELDADLTVNYETHCARCDALINKELCIKVVFPIAESLENMDNDEYIILENEKICLSELARETFFLNVPMTHLCREDCKGLCMKCGADKNKGDCGCDLSEKDPRWKALEGFFDED